jgi:hypothetical protein
MQKITINRNTYADKIAELLGLKKGRTMNYPIRQEIKEDIAEIKATQNLILQLLQDKIGLGEK